MYERIARWYRSYLSVSQRRPWTLLAVLVAVSGLLAWYGAGIKVRGDLEDLFPEDTPAVVRAKETRRVLGNTQELRVLIGSPDRTLNRAVAARLAAFIEARPDDILRVEWRRDVAFFEKNGLLFLSLEDLTDLDRQVSEAIQKEVKKDLGLDDFDLDTPEPAPDKGAEAKKESSLPSIEEVKKKHKVEGFKEYFESPDGQVIAVKATPKFKPSDATRTRALNDAIEAEIAKIQAENPGKGLEFTMDGDFSQLTKAAKQIMNDAAESGLWSLIGIAVVVILFFRRVRALFVVVLVLGVSTACMLAFAQVAVGYLNLVTSIIFAILFGMGVDYIIHGMSRIDEEYHGNVSLEQALSDGLFGLARPVFNAMLTTAVTFFALVFFDFRGFSQLGLIAGFGVSFALLAFYLIYPPLTIAMHRIWKQKPSKRKEVVDAAPAHGGGEHAVEEGMASAPPASRFQKRLGWAIVAFVVAVAGVATVIALDLPFGSDMGKFRVKDSGAENSLKKKYKEAETRTASPALVVTKDLAETERLQRYLEANMAKFPSLREVSSVWSFIPKQQDEKLVVIKEIKRRIDNKYGALEGQAKTDADELRKYLSPTKVTLDDLPKWVRQKFTDTDGQFGRYVLLYTRGGLSDALVAREIERQLGTITVPPEGDKPALTVTSSATFYVSGEAYTVVKREGPIAALIGLAVVFIVVLFDFRRPRELLMICVPILASFAITLAIMALADVPLDLFNVVVLPQIFGIGIDTGTHLTHRIKEGGPRVIPNVRATAIAAGVSSLLTTIGFAALLPVANEGLRSIGLVAVLGIVAAYAVNLLMFTAFLWIARPTRVV